MIISLSEIESSFIVSESENQDTICFFRVEKAICGDENLWWEALCTSLRLKRSVLILGPNLEHQPAIDSSRRWQASDNWCWLSPRSLSVISEAYQKNPMSFQEFKTFLKNSK